MPERAAGEGEERLRSILDDAPIMIYVYDRDGCLLFGNREFERVLGVDRDALIGKTRVEFFSAEDAAVHRAHDLAVLASGHGSRLEETLPQADGEHTYISDKFPLRDDDGGIYAVGGISTDITLRKRDEERMRRSDSRLAEAQGVYHVGNWEWNIADGQIEWSDEVYRIVGEAPQGFAANYEGFLGRVHRDDRGMVERAIDDALNGRRPYDVEYRIVRPSGDERVLAVRGQTAEQTLARDRSHGSGTMLESCFRRKNGEACWARVSTSARFDGDSNYTGALAIVCDVTAAQAREAELRSSERFVSAITDSMAEGMFALDGEGRLTYMNRAAEKLLGLDPARVG